MSSGHSLFVLGVNKHPVALQVLPALWLLAAGCVLQPVPSLSSIQQVLSLGFSLVSPVQKRVLSQGKERGLGEGGWEDERAVLCPSCVCRVGTGEEALPSGLSDLPLPTPGSG